MIALLMISTNMMAEKGFELNQEIIVNVSADELWEMIGPGFIEVYKWSSNIDHAEGSGTAEFDGASCSDRHCDVNVKGFSSISETLTKYDAQNMSLAYEVFDGMPGFITQAKNDWTVVPIDDNHSKIVLVSTFGSKGLMGAMMNGMMKKKMTKTLYTVLNDAKVYAETGTVSAAKQKRMDQLSKKTKRSV